VENLRRENINTDFIVQDEEANTGAAFITVIPSGENSIVSALGANNRCSIEQVEAAATEIERSDLLLVQLGVPAEVVDRAIQIAVDRDVLVQLDPSPLGEPLPDLWRRAYTLVPNQTEASEISGIQITDIVSTVEAAQAIRREGIAVVIITLGPSGCLVASEQGIYRVDGFQVEPVDATAAGDSFAGALATALGEGMPITEAAVFANAAGALATTIAGAQPSLPRREAVDDFLMQRGGIGEVTVEEL
jgi:ribokinase